MKKRYRSFHRSNSRVSDDATRQRRFYCKYKNGISIREKYPLSPHSAPPPPELPNARSVIKRGGQVDPACSPASSHRCSRGRRWTRSSVSRFAHDFDLRANYVRSSWTIFQSIPSVVHRDDDTKHFVSLFSFFAIFSPVEFLSKLFQLSNIYIYLLGYKERFKAFPFNFEILIFFFFHTRRVRSYRRSFDNALPCTKYVLYLR